MKQLTCEQRIDAEYEHEEQYLLWVTDDLDMEIEEIKQFEDENGLDPDDRTGSWYELMLDVEVATPNEVHGGDFLLRGVPEPYRYDHAVHFQRSWGGPGDGFIVFMCGYEVVSAYYYFQDWFDGAVRRVSGEAESALGMLAECFVEA